MCAVQEKRKGKKKTLNESAQIKDAGERKVGPQRKEISSKKNVTLGMENGLIVYYH